jgi:hypothetical protein
MKALGSRRASCRRISTIETSSCLKQTKQNHRKKITKRIFLNGTLVLGMAKGGTGILSVDGKEVDNKKIPHTIPVLMTIDESFDVGVDTRLGVEDNDYLPHRQASQVNHQAGSTYARGSEAPGTGDTGSQERRAIGRVISY